MYGYLSLVVVFLVSIILTFVWTALAKRLGVTGRDVHKPGNPEVPEMGGIIILPSLVIGLAALYLIDSHYVVQFGFIVIVAAFAWALGLVDDLAELSAIPKFVLSILIGLPIFLFVNPFSHPLMVPFLKPVRLPLVYPFLALGLIAGTANSFNSYDVVNGSTTFSATIISLAMGGVLFLRGELGLATVVGMVAAVSLTLFIFNAYPAKVFIGDTGSFALGGAIAAAAIASFNESFLFFAILPMIVNAAAKFMSLGKIYEHHKAGVKITRITEDGKIASYEGNGSISLVRLLVAQKPLSEKQVFMGLAVLVTLSTVLALAILPFVGVTLW
ncbi:MAG: hypothetical protein ACP5SK_00695 [Thermoprotei archaeon]